MTAVFCLLIFGPVFTQTYTVDRPALQIVQELSERLAGGPGEHLPPDLAELLELVDTRVHFEWSPARHYAEAGVEMLQAPDVILARRLNRCHKTLTVETIDHTSTRIVSRLDIGWGPEGRLSNGLLERQLWPRVVAWELSKIPGMAKADAPVEQPAPRCVVRRRIGRRAR